MSALFPTKSGYTPKQISRQKQFAVFCIGFQPEVKLFAAPVKKILRFPPSSFPAYTIPAESWFPPRF